MRERPLSACEKACVAACVQGGVRLDGRGPTEMRKRKITFGATRGNVTAHLGSTRVFAQVSCEVAVPFPDRPTEGTIRYSLELSPMASASFEAGRPSESAVEANRLIEIALRESRAIETESLCILAGEKVWSVRVDLHVLDFDGNLVDCACMAAVAALVHFRRPFVSVQGDSAKIHDLREHEPVPLAVHHRPVCITMAIFQLDSEPRIVVDPTALEEAVAEGLMTVGMNGHGEICCVHQRGGISLSPDKVKACVRTAEPKVARVLQQIARALEMDEKERAKGVWTRDELKKINTSAAQEADIDAPENMSDDEMDTSAVSVGPSFVEVDGPGTASLFEGKSTWDDGGDEKTKGKKKRKKLGK